MADLHAWFTSIPTWSIVLVTIYLVGAFFNSFILCSNDVGEIFGWPLITLAWIVKFIGVLGLVVYCIFIDTLTSVWRHVRDIFRRKWLQDYKSKRDSDDDPRKWGGGTMI